MKNYRYITDTIKLSIDSDKCIGCGQCITVCPHRVLSLIDKKAVIVDLGSCMECRACETNCPTEAIKSNPDNGCGCAIHLLNTWVAKLSKKIVKKNLSAVKPPDAVPDDTDQHGTDTVGKHIKNIRTPARDKTLMKFVA